MVYTIAEIATIDVSVKGSLKSLRINQSILAWQRNCAKPLKSRLSPKYGRSAQLSKVDCLFIEGLSARHFYAGWFIGQADLLCKLHVTLMLPKQHSVMFSSDAPGTP